MDELPQEYASLPIGEFAFPGPLRDRLVAAIVAGEKTTTSCLHLEFTDDELPQVGQREVVIDSDARPVAVIETTEIRVLPLGEVDAQHAIDEGEGFLGVEDWRVGHEEFWHSSEYRSAISQPQFTVTDATLVVAQRFRLVEDLRHAL
ncbi:ASCH domain-containing protein [Allokutzneria sp. A3M-2-11 16]|uniref:ASCH domain-containing protein n=1 Tax=Allokutzneria sp. A3M-2-11 16 TaxID=2962043 RepID=UPI0020B86365|nr:ASCH domain-containing protein [Allokutzneria sp. A3M-2-11 16]MCP3805314.1 ASCH domain-containing protein [Allokutzneria sp. A3M-2-11 16]